MGAQLGWGNTPHGSLLKSNTDIAAIQKGKGVDLWEWDLKQLCNPMLSMIESRSQGQVQSSPAQHHNHMLCTTIDSHSFLNQECFWVAVELTKEIMSGRVNSNHLKSHPDEVAKGMVNSYPVFSACLNKILPFQSNKISYYVFQCLKETNLSPRTVWVPS